MATTYVGPFEIHNGAIGTTSHEGRDGWTFTPRWSPGDSDEVLKAVLEECINYGKAKRSEEIGRLLGVSK